MSASGEPSPGSDPGEEGVRTVILGTAGHIDHGKSTLVRALTGVDPDRLEEERQRGMTIDLGFAPYQHRSGATVGIIDVPGHERFIKNMVAGVTSVDVALLVVAADDGVMPQTIEHLQILRLLGVQRGLVVLTKTDLVDAELVELARDDVLELLEGTFLEEAPVLPVSAATGQGLDALRGAIDDLVDRVPPRSDEGPFRLPVQRVFSAKGHGLVVTGVPVTGRVAPGDELELVGGNRTVRVRGVQAYGRSRSSARAGHSSALNLAGASVADVRRGDVVATPGAFRPARFVTVDYRHLHLDVPLRQRHPVRLHGGTAEVLGRASLLEADVMREGRQAVQLRLEESITLAPGDRVLLRDAASMVVLGGGQVLASGEGRLKRFKQRVLEELSSRRLALHDAVALAEAVVAGAGPRGCRLEELAVQVGHPPRDLLPRLEDAVAEGRLVAAGDRWISPAAFERLKEDLLGALKRLHKERPLLEWAELKDLRGRVPHDEPLLRAALAADQRFETASGGRVRRRGHRGTLGPELQAARERILAALEEGGASPPAIDPAFTGLGQKETASLLDAMRRSGEVVAVGGHLFAPATLERLERILVEHGRARGGEVVIPELRDELGTTRKFLIPLLEHFDARGLTVRHGDRRVVRQRPAET